MTQYEELARVLAYTIRHLGGSLKFKQADLDNMSPCRLVWDTSDPEYVTLATISNDIVMLTVDGSTGSEVDTSCP